MKKLSLALIFALTSSPAFALFCPTNFNQMNIGDSIDQVTQQCGAPAVKTTFKKGPNQPEQWTYFVTMGPNQAASVKLEIALDANQKVINIYTQAQSLANSSLCGSTIAIGDTAEKVKKVCGKPALVTQTQTAASVPQGNNPPETTVTEYKYNTTPPITLIFENGKLIERKSS